MGEVKRGRPRKFTGKEKDRQLHIRLSASDLAKLSYIASKEGWTTSECVRDAIDLKYKFLQYRE